MKAVFNVPHVSHVCILLCVSEGWDDTEGGDSSSSVSGGDRGGQSALSCMFVVITASCGEFSGSLIHAPSSAFIHHNQEKQE